MIGRSENEEAPGASAVDRPDGTGGPMSADRTFEGESGWVERGGSAATATPSAASPAQRSRALAPGSSSDQDEETEAGRRFSTAADSSSRRPTEPDTPAQGAVERGSVERGPVESGSPERGTTTEQRVTARGTVDDGPAAPDGESAPDGEEPDWDPTGLDLARSVVGSLVNGPGSGARRGRPGTGGGAGGRGSGRARRSGEGARVVGQSAYADLAGTTGAHPDDRDPQVLDSTIGRLVADRGWNTDVAVAGALSRWDQIVGPQIAEHCRAERYADGVLTVRADSTAWATQVRLLAANLVKRLNEDLGDGTVHRIVVQGPTGYDWRKRGLGTRDARGPRDTFG